MSEVVTATSLNRDLMAAGHNLQPCIVCGFTAMDALEQLRGSA